MICDGIRAESTATTLSDINLSSNELSENSCVAIAALLTHCGVRRQAETWQHSLRGRTPDPEEGTGGLRAINLSFNPGIGDDGAYEMLHALEDDTWTQKLNLRACNIGDAGARAVHALFLGQSALETLDVSDNAISARMLTAVQRVARGSSGGPALTCDDGSARPKPPPAPPPAPKPKRQAPKTGPPDGAPWRGPGPGGRVRTPNWEHGKRRPRVTVSSPAPPLLALGGSPITKSPVLFQDTPPAKHGLGEDWSTLKRALPPAKQQPNEWSEIKRALDSKKHEIASIRETQKSMWDSELATLSSTAGSTLSDSQDGAVGPPLSVHSLPRGNSQQQPAATASAPAPVSNDTGPGVPVPDGGAGGLPAQAHLADATYFASEQDTAHTITDAFEQLHGLIDQLTHQRLLRKTAEPSDPRSFGRPLPAR